MKQACFPLGLTLSPVTWSWLQFSPWGHPCFMVGLWPQQWHSWCLIPGYNLLDFPAAGTARAKTRSGDWGCEGAGCSSGGLFVQASAS